MSRYGSIVGFPYSAGIGPYNFDAFIATRTIVNENNPDAPSDTTTVSIEVQTHGIKTNFKLYWSTLIISAPNNSITSNSFMDNTLTGEFYVDSLGKYTISRTIKADYTTTGPRTFRIAIRLGNPNTGGVMIKSDIITINDTALTPLTATLNAAVPNPIVQVINRASYAWDLFYPPVTGGLGTNYAYASSNLPTNIGNINASTGYLTGTPTVTSTTPTAYTVNVTQNYAIPYQYAQPTSISFNMVVASTLTATVNTSEFQTAAGVRYIPPGLDLTPFTPVIPNGGWTGYPAGTLSYNYSLNTALPAGVVQDPNTGVISGRASGQGTSSTRTYINTVKDNATNNGYTSPQSAGATFQLQVPFIMLPGATVADRMFVIGTPVTRFMPVSTSAITGSPIKTYVISPLLTGTGLTFDNATGNITGTPSAVQSSAPYTVTVTDECLPPQTYTKTFNMGFSSVLTSTKVQTTTRYIPVSTTLTTTPNAFTPVTTNGGGHLTTFSCAALSSVGLSINSITGLITGTTKATADIANVAYTVSVADSSTPPQAAPQTFNMNIVSTIVAVSSIPSRVIVAGSSVTASNYRPITCTTGSPTKTYAIKTGTTALPGTLTMTSSTGQIIGTPSTATSPQTLRTYTVTVTDALSIPTQSSENTFQLGIAPVLVISIINAVVHIKVNTPTTFNALSIEGGWLPRIVTPSTTLPGSLTITSAGVISGNPGSVIGSISAQFTVTDSASTPQNKTTASLSPSTLVINTVAALTGSVSIATRIIGVGQSISYSPLNIQGGGGTLTYASTPLLPNGLQFVDGFISGSATTTSANTSYNITVTDSCVPTPQTVGISPNPLLTTSILVVARLILTASTTIPILTQGVAFTRFNTVTTSGGTGTKTYSISPELPNGLVFSTTNGSIASGTPTINYVGTNQTYTVTIVDQCSVPQQATAQFTLQIKAPQQVRFLATTAPTTTYSWVVPQGVTIIGIVCIGGGGGGGGQLVLSGGASAGGGGGGGGLSYTNNVSVTPGATVTVTVGAAGRGGAGGNGSPVRGTNGGTSSVTINNVVVCRGGGGTGGAVGSSGGSGAAGGVGGVVGTGGGSGGAGGAAGFSVSPTSGAGGGGGGAGGPGGTGGIGTPGTQLTTNTGGVPELFSRAGGGGVGGNRFVGSSSGGGAGDGSGPLSGDGLPGFMSMVTATTGYARGGGGGTYGGGNGGYGTDSTGDTLPIVFGGGGLYGGGGAGGGSRGSSGKDGGAGVVRIVWGAGRNSYSVPDIFV
jgi:hypothetical protein